MNKLVYKKNILLYVSLLLIVFANTKVSIGQAVTCGAAVNVIVNGSCSAGAIMGTPSVAATGNASVSCGTNKTVKKEFWYKFTTLNTTGATTLSVSHTSGGSATTKDLAIELLTSCSTATINCGNISTTATTETISASLTPLTQYFVRVANVGSGTIVNMNSVVLCIKQPPVNDEPSGAINLPIVANTCALTAFSNTNCIATSCMASPACANYTVATASDVWFTAVVPTNGLFVQTEKNPSSNFKDGGMAVYSGVPCGTPTPTLLACSDGSPDGAIAATDFANTGFNIDMPSIYIPTTLAAAGSTVYIRLWKKTPAVSGNTAGTFSICASDMGPCGNLANNDFCNTPAPLTAAAATFSSSSSSLYTTDTPGDLDYAANCVSPAVQNSWYSFLASGATQTFSFTNISNCSGGLNAEVFQVTKNSLLCCKNFTSMSSGGVDCLVGVSSGSFAFTVSGLTNGTTYHLMVSNTNAGQSCIYTIPGWNHTGILPLEFVSFTAENVGKSNLIKWQTASDNTTNSYDIEKSQNAVDFETVGSLKGKSNTQNITYYSMYDDSPFDDFTYYRIKKTDYKNKIEYSNTISVNLKSLYDNIYNLQPNPTSSNVNFEYYSKSNNTIHIELVNYAGSVVFVSNQPLEEGKNALSIPMSDLDNGVYILKVVSDKSKKITHTKVIKN